MVLHVPKGAMLKTGSIKLQTCWIYWMLKKLTYFEVFDYFSYLKASVPFGTWVHLQVELELKDLYLINMQCIRRILLRHNLPHVPKGSKVPNSVI